VAGGLAELCHSGASADDDVPVLEVSTSSLIMFLSWGCLVAPLRCNIPALEVTFYSSLCPSIGTVPLTH
jgi:hypothetical protein